VATRLPLAAGAAAATVGGGGGEGGEGSPSTAMASLAPCASSSCSCCCCCCWAKGPVGGAPAAWLSSPAAAAAAGAAAAGAGAAGCGSPRAASTTPATSRSRCCRRRTSPSCCQYQSLPAAGRSCLLPFFLLSPLLLSGPCCPRTATASPQSTSSRRILVKDGSMSMATVGWRRSRAAARWTPVSASRSSARRWRRWGRGRVPRAMAKPMAARKVALSCIWGWGVGEERRRGSDT
jgi:hypothetical protein